MTDDPKAARKTKMPDDWDEALDGEWDDEFVSERALAEGADLELIVEYLNKHLDPERTEQVRKRLDEDEAFRDLAAPLILTWSIPKHIERHPRPAGELERSWDEFTKRHGFTHQRRKTRRRRLWLLALAIVGVGLAAYAASAPLREWYVLRRDFALVPYDTGWIPLGQAGDSIFAQLSPGKNTSLRVARELVRTDKDDERHVLLEGTARFRVLALDSINPTPRRSGIVVRTRGGIVSAGEGEFTVTARADTTEVEVHRPSRRRFMYFIPIPTAVEVRRDPTADPILLRELDRARLVRGQKQQPQRLTEQPRTEKQPTEQHPTARKEP